MSFSDYYKRGIALGTPDIRNDCIVFHFSGEEISVPTARMLAFPLLAHFNGAQYEAKIKDVRLAAKE